MSDGDVPFFVLVPAAVRFVSPPDDPFESDDFEDEEVSFVSVFESLFVSVFELPVESLLASLVESLLDTSLSPSVDFARLSFR